MKLFLNFIVKNDKVNISLKYCIDFLKFYLLNDSYNTIIFYFKVRNDCINLSSRQELFSNKNKIFLNFI